MGDVDHDLELCVNVACRPCAEVAERVLVNELAGVDETTAARLGV